MQVVLSEGEYGHSVKVNMDRYLYCMASYQDCILIGTCSRLRFQVLVVL